MYRQTGEVYKVGISVWTGYPTSVKGFKEAMAEGGLIEGKNAKYLYGTSGLNPQKQHEIAQGFKAAKEGDMSGIAGGLDILRRRFEALGQLTIKS